MLSLKTFVKYLLFVIFLVFLINGLVGFLYLHSHRRIVKTSDSRGQVAPPACNYNETELLRLFPNFLQTSGHQLVDKSCAFPPVDLHCRNIAGEVSLSLAEVENIHNASFENGHYRHHNCTALERVAIIVPFRDREKHLVSWLYHLIPKLRRQNIDFSIYIIEQEAGSNFNRGMLRNIGFVESQKDNSFSCYVFNDVDTIPEDDRNLYLCSHNKIRHLVTGLDREKYTLPYANLLGGIIAFTPEQFRKLNGYSNMYFQWGAEDDDLCRRMMKAGLTMERPPKELGYITTLPHKHDPKLNKRMVMYRTVGMLAHKDGINSLKYEIISRQTHPLFTRIIVRINENHILEEYNKIPKKELEKGKLDLACSPIKF